MIQKSMDLGVLGSPNTIFVRKFRWTIEIFNPLNQTRAGDQKLVDEYCFKHVDIDFKENKLEMIVMEVITEGSLDIQIQSWLEQKSHDGEYLKFTTYDGTGRPLYEYIFDGLEVIGEKMSFDYASTEESTRELSVKFSNYKRNFLFMNNDIHQKTT